VGLILYRFFYAAAAVEIISNYYPQFSE